MLGDKILLKKTHTKKAQKNTWVNINQTGKISRPHASWDLKACKCQETLKRLTEIGKFLIEIRKATSGRLSMGSRCKF